MHKLDLLMFHVQSFFCFKHSGVIFGILYFSYGVFCSFFSGISNFLFHLFEYLFPWFSQLFVLLWIFAIFNLESYVLLFFCHPFKVWIWYLVVIYFLLVSDMNFCRAFDYVLELFPFVPLLCCYVCATLSFLFNLLSISFLAFFILSKLSSVEPLLTCVGHPLMISSYPCQFYSGNEKSVVWRFFCPSIWTCIVQDLFVLLIQDNVINLIEDLDILLCYLVSSSLRPCPNVLSRVLEAADLRWIHHSFHRIPPSWYHSNFVCLLTIAQYNFWAQFFFLICCWNPLLA